MRGWLFNSVLALLCWGVWAFLPKLAVQYVPPRSAFFFQGLGGVLVAVFVFGTMQEKIVYDWRGLVLAMGAGLAGYAGMLFFLLAVQDGKVSVVAPITALYPVIAIVLGAFLLAEGLSWPQWLGVALALSGVALISTGGA